MKITVHRQGLLAVCKTVLGMVPSGKNINPVLNNFKVVTHDDGLTMQATDTEMGLRLEFRSVQVQEAGAALWPAQRITAILAELPDENLTITSTQGSTRIVTDSAEFELPGEDPQNFPDLPEPISESGYSLLAGDLARCLRRTLFAVADENTRYTATKGVLWNFKNLALDLVATDGRRLATERMELEEVCEPKEPVLPVLPGKAVQALAKLLTDPDERVLVSISANEALLRSERGTLYTRLVDGRFPAWQAVIPREADCLATAQVSASSLQTALRQAATMTDVESNRVLFTWEANKLTLSARGQQVGRSRVSIPVTFTGQPLEINLAPSMLLDFLRVLPTDQEVTWHLKDSSSPVLLTGDGNYRYVAVPIVVKERES